MPMLLILFHADSGLLSYLLLSAVFYMTPYLFCILQSLSSQVKICGIFARRKGGTEPKKPDVVNWAADSCPCVSARAAAVLPGAYNGNCQSCNPSEGCRAAGIERADRLSAWLVLGWQPSSQFLYLSFWEFY